ncbi:MAG: LPS-assembly protein LptD, partial [bacterium]
IIKEGNDEFLANRLDYNLKTKKGHLYYGSTSKSSSHYFGKLIATTKENDLYIKSGRYTTCSLNDPHYHFYSPRIKYVEGNDRIIAKGVILYVKDLPVFALPFLVFSVDKRRHSGFLPVDIGNFVRGERFIRNIGYYLAPSPFWDYTIAVDFDELTGWLIRTKLNYALANYFSGSIAGSYKFESSDAITSIRKKSRWDLSVSHFETIYENYRLSFSGNFVSDRDYFYDTRYSPTERMTTNLSSNLLFSRNFRNSSLNISLTRIYNLVQNRITEDMPSIRFMRYQQPIISRGILKNFTFSYNGYFTRRRETNPWFNHWATSSEFRLSFPFNYNPYFNFSPGFNISTFLYDSDKTGKRYPFLSNLSMYTTLSTRLYGRSPAIFGQRIRHVLQPAITYSYSPERKNNLNLFTVGGISPYSSKINLLQWSVNNLFELISKNGKQKIELTSLSIQSGYNWENKTKPINDIITSARVEPFSNLNITLNSRFSWYSKDEKLKVPRFVEGGVTTSIFFGGNLSWGETLPQKEWRVNLYHYYTKQKSSIGETNWLKGDISLFLTPNWRVDYSIYYDIENNEKVSENITLWRDLHCWELTIGIIPSGYRAGFYFRINIKEIPDVKLEYGKGKVWGVF